MKLRDDIGMSDVCQPGEHHQCQNVTLNGWPSQVPLPHETKKDMTKRRPHIPLDIQLPLSTGR
jgi:hypothetical protein